MIDSTQGQGPEPRVRAYSTSDESPWPDGRRLLPHRRLARLARRHGTRTAVVGSSGSYSYTEFDDLVTRLASGLLALGARRGEVVAVCLDNIPEYLAMYYAASRGGFAYAPISRHAVAEEIDWLLAELAPRLVLGDVTSPAAVTVPEVLSAGSDRMPEGHDVRETDVMSLSFSSGTTGRPKMFGRDQRLREHYALEMALEMGLGAGDVNLVVAPLAHAAMQIAVSNLAVGAQVVVREKFDAATLFADVEAVGATNAMLVPTMITRLVDRPAPPCLTTVVSLGAPLVPQLKRRMAENWPGVGLYEMYGSTEAGMVTVLRPEEQHHHPEAVGKPAFLAEVVVCDEAGRSLGTGELGTIYVRGPMTATVMGSIPAPELPGPLRGGGWIGFGDLGEFDAEGFLSLTARRDDLILSGALNVYPAEVERVLLEIPGVDAAAVVGVEDPEWGQVVCATLVGSVTEDVVAEHCAARLATYKRPRRIRFLDHLPTSPNGKLSRSRLREFLNAEAPVTDLDRSR
ncbi:class I adenylate-forming enzyme family protein [Pseudonocardia xishanensis]|uniref:Acyl-CoA synthetase n=1 Tax=Pseudonocardia xishanensis TaxID=630995 RepID=A0ABP8RYE2_9PSEU